MCSVTAILFAPLFLANLLSPQWPWLTSRSAWTLSSVPTSSLLNLRWPQTIKDVRREKIRHELIVHLRGPAVGEVQQLFDDHVKSKESVSNERAKKSRNSAGDAPAACALADAAARNT